MKVQSLLAIGSLFSAFAQAANTTFEFSLEGRYEDDRISIVQLNKQLKEKGLDGLPEIIKISAEGQLAYHRVLTNRIEAAREAGLLTEGQQLNIEASYLFEYSEICFRGNIMDVPVILKAMADSGTGKSWEAFLNIDAGINGFAIGTQKFDVADFLKSEEAMNEYYGVEAGEDSSDYIPSEITKFLNWKKKDQVYVITDLGPQGDGTEMYGTIIKRCK